MDVARIVEALRARVLAMPDGGRAVTRAYAGDRISDLLAHADAETLLVTHLTGSSLLRLVELLDVAAVCLVNDVDPGEEVLEAARDAGTAVIAAPLELFETCGRLHALFAAAAEPPP